MMTVAMLVMALLHIEEDISSMFVLLVHRSETHYKPGHCDFRRGPSWAAESSVKFPGHNPESSTWLISASF